MKSVILDLDCATYRITSTGEVYTSSKYKIPLVTKGMVHTGEFKKVSKPERLLKVLLNNRGYLTVKLNGKTKMVHRLVAESFIANPENKPCVNHLDGNKLNNHVTNLEWNTVAENNAHARSTGLHVQAKGHKIKYKSSESKLKALSNLKDKTVLSNEDVIYCRSVCVPRNSEFSVTALAKRFGVSPTAMSNAIRGKTFINVK